MDRRTKFSVLGASCATAIGHALPRLPTIAFGPDGPYFPTARHIRHLMEDAVGFILGFEQPAKRAAAEPRATRHGKVGGGDSCGGAATGSTSNVSENCEHSRPIVA